MANSHPDLQAEQAYVDHAYDCLEAARVAAKRLTHLVEGGPGGTTQARFERDVLWETAAGRLSQLDLGSRSLVFGRIDHSADAGGEVYYVGRLGVWDDKRDVVVVDWRAPVAEAFYRATGREPLGLARRRHFSTRGRTLLGIEDELFGDLSFLDAPTPDGRPEVRGEGALIAALETARTGRLADIVATIQAEQDEIIRSPLPGVLVVQGGPGTGKTVVALHRAAYLLYSHRFPLEGQGVLVVGPNRLFLAYIEQVLPSLGEAGVELAVLADLIGHVKVDRRDSEDVARIKGDLGIVRLIERAVRDRERPLRSDLRVGYGLQSLWFTVEQSEQVVREARRRFRTHNGARKFVEHELFAALAATARDDVSAETVRERAGDLPEIREALERMWPVLTPAQLLHDLFGSRALLRSAGRTSPAIDVELLYRPRAGHVDEVSWTNSDVAMLDEARELLGPRPGKKSEDEITTYGHIVVDEAQDLSPMELRMLTRRSLSGSMTVVGDIAQSTGAWAHSSWSEILEHLPDRRPSRVAELTVGYRIPAPLMALAARVLREAAPALTPPQSVRQDGDRPSIERVESFDSDAFVDVVRRELEAVERGNIAIVCPVSLVDAVSATLDSAHIDHGGATRRGLDQQVTVVPVPLVKGLEVDAAIVVEPGRIVSEEVQGMRALYVALTRATRRVTVVHADALPAVLME